MPAKAGSKRSGFDPWVREILWRRAWQPIPVFLPGESHGQRRLVGYSPWGCKESDTTEATKHSTFLPEQFSGISTINHTLLCHHHHHPFPELLYNPRWKLYPLNPNAPFPLPPAASHRHSTCCFYLTILSTSNK